MSLHIRPRTILVLLTVAGAISRAPLSGQVVQGPPDSYAFVATSDVTEPSQLLARIRQALIHAVSKSGLAPAGYPRPCHVTPEPDPQRPGASFLFCVERPTSEVEPDGILLDSEGHYVQFSIVDYPSARYFLTRVYLVPRLPYAKLESEARFDIPRVAIHVPHVSTSWHPEIWRVLEDGIDASGASVIESWTDPR